MPKKPPKEEPAKPTTTRRNSKAPKKRPGVNAKAYTGRTTGGYSPKALARRVEIRAARAILDRTL
jgi:hypothetical protein